MPLTTQESIGLGVGILNIWDEHVDAHSLRQLDLIINQYIDDRVVAYIRDQDGDLRIRMVNIGKFRTLRANKIFTL